MKAQPILKVGPMVPPVTLNNSPTSGELPGHTIAKRIMEKYSLHPVSSDSPSEEVPISTVLNWKPNCVKQSADGGWGTL